MTRNPLRAAVGLALVAVGAGAFLVTSSVHRGSHVLPGNLPINASATDPGDITANNSPTIVRNPTSPANLAVANRIDSPGFSCALRVSFDGGSTWGPTAIPFPEGEELPARCFAPDVAFGPDGSLHLSFVTLKGAGNVPNALWVSASRDGGRTLGPPTQVSGPLAFQVRLLADPTSAGRLYLFWVQARDVARLAFPDTGYPIVVSRSDDGGSSWQAPVTLSAPARLRVIAPSPTVDTKGHLFVLYLDLRDDRLDYHGAHGGHGGPPDPGPWQLVLARSTDGGTTWREGVVEENLVPAERIVVFFPPAPSVAVDPQGQQVYVAFLDARLGDPDVWLWASSDGGSTFSAARRVNDTRPGDGTSQYLPKLAVAPDGRLDVVYYDRRADPGNVMTEVSLQSSYDGGRSFTRRLPLTDKPFDSRIGFGNERDLPDLGSRLGLLSTRQSALAVWTDTRGGTQVSRKQDLARATVTFTDTPPLQGVVRYGGLFLAATGLLALTWWARRLPS